MSEALDVPSDRTAASSSPVTNFAAPAPTAPDRGGASVSDPSRSPDRVEAPTPTAPPVASDASARAPGGEASPPPSPAAEAETGARQAPPAASDTPRAVQDAPPAPRPDGAPPSIGALRAQNGVVDWNRYDAVAAGLRDGSLARGQLSAGDAANLSSGDRVIELYARNQGHFDEAVRNQRALMREAAETGEDLARMARESGTAGAWASAGLAAIHGMDTAAHAAAFSQAPGAAGLGATYLGAQRLTTGLINARAALTSGYDSLFGGGAPSAAAGGGGEGSAAATEAGAGAGDTLQRVGQAADALREPLRRAAIDISEGSGTVAHFLERPVRRTGPEPELPGTLSRMAGTYAAGRSAGEAAAAYRRGDMEAGTTHLRESTVGLVRSHTVYGESAEAANRAIDDLQAMVTNGRTNAGSVRLLGDVLSIAPSTQELGGMVGSMADVGADIGDVRYFNEMAARAENNPVNRMLPGIADRAASSEAMTRALRDRARQRGWLTTEGGRP